MIDPRTIKILHQQKINDLQRNTSMDHSPLSFPGILLALQIWLARRRERTDSESSHLAGGYVPCCQEDVQTPVSTRC